MRSRATRSWAAPRCTPASLGPLRLPCRGRVDCIRLGRQIVARLGWRKLGPGPYRAGRGPRYDPEELLGIASVDLAVPFDIREVIARVVDGSALRRVQAPVRHATSSPAGPPSTAYAVGILAQQPRRALFRGVPEGGPVHPAGQPDRRAAALPAEHHRLHGGQALRAGGHHQGRRQDDQRRGQQPRAAPDADDRRFLRGRQLRHVRRAYDPRFLFRGPTPASR
ncbi:MAG: hypothetical protein KatS3mg131_2709 [Candidatus Tectimicrobiota bacterium]|nr:MAG: hypothetical protein KatS3mg131_2709 [Candidatus Tectomicrobia bacterium]